jgi:hypothetical protein
MYKETIDTRRTKEPADPLSSIKTAQCESTSNTSV